MFSSPEARSLNLFIHESFNFKRFFDEYIIMKHTKDRVKLAEDYVIECSLDHHRGLHQQTIEEVTEALVNWMEDEIDKMENQPRKGSSMP